MSFMKQADKIRKKKAKIIPKQLEPKTEKKEVVEEKIIDQKAKKIVKQRKHIEIRGEYGEWLQDWRFLPYKGSGLMNQPLLIQGATGTGKSYMANSLFWECVDMGDIVIIPGDTAFEPRHFLNYIKDSDVTMKVLIPEEFEYTFQSYNLEKKLISNNLENILKKNNVDLIKFNPYTENINHFIRPCQILVIMDCCYDLPSRTAFWWHILKQLKLRKRYSIHPITILFHEFGILFPIISFKDQYKYVDLMSQDFVEFRKSYIRIIGLQQYRAQCYWKLEPQFEMKIIKGSNASRGSKFDTKYGRGKKINEYSVISSGIEDIKIASEGKFSELNEIWKIIPEKEIQFIKESVKEVVIKERDFRILGKWIMGMLHKEIAIEENLERSSISYILKDLGSITVREDITMKDIIKRHLLCG